MKKHEVWEVFLKASASKHYDANSYVSDKSNDDKAEKEEATEKQKRQLW